MRYATVEELSDWWSLDADLPADAGDRLDYASELVQEASGSARYFVDADGVAQDPTTRSALHAATLHQVAFWTANQIDPFGGSLVASSAAVASKSMGGRSVSYDTSSAAQLQSARTQAQDSLCPRSVRILTVNGLTGQQPAVC